LGHTVVDENRDVDIPLDVRPVHLMPALRVDAQLPPPPALRSSYIEIDGKKNPERILEYIAWRQAFRSLAGLEARKATAAIDQDLPLTTRERTLVFDAARQQVERDTRCDAQNGLYMPSDERPVRRLRTRTKPCGP
jgi:hypothetical protein